MLPQFRKTMIKICQAQSGYIAFAAVKKSDGERRKKSVGHSPTLHFIYHHHSLQLYINDCRDADFVNAAYFGEVGCVINGYQNLTASATR